MSDRTDRSAVEPARPGRGLGIVAVVAAVLAPVIGLILGFVALDQSRRAGLGNAPARVAVVVAIILIVLWIAAVVVGLVLAAGVVQDCEALGPGVHEVDGVTVTCTG